MSKPNPLIIYKVKKELDNIDLKYKHIHANNDIEAIRTWLSEFKNSANTYISYRQTAERFLLWCLSNNIKFNELKREDIKGYEEFLQAPTPHEFWCGPAKPRDHNDWKPFVRGLSPSSVNLNIRILSNLYMYLVQSGYLLHNPFSLNKSKSSLVVNKTIDKYLTHKEWKYIIEYIELLPKDTEVAQQNYERTKWIFGLLYLTGCRRSEIVNAKMSDFINRRDNWWLRVVGKGNKYGEIPVTSDLLIMLINYRRFLKLPDYPTNMEHNIPIICNVKFRQGKYMPISDSMLYKIIRTTCKTIAEEVKQIDPAAAFVIDKVSTHWLRHTSATHQVDAGIDIRVVKENLRHSMLETTMRYQHTEADSRHVETNNKFWFKK
ncbi:MAG: tyrosine-type recombinase/integrase [Neisseriaceae bacterium]